MSWSFFVGIITSVISLGGVIYLWNQWVRDTSRIEFYQSRYKLRDAQLESTLKEWERLNKHHSELLEQHSVALGEWTKDLEVLGETKIELSLANGRIQQMTNLYLQEQKRADELQKELDAIFAVGGSDD